MIATLANILVGLVALLHLYFLVLEMFLWTTPTGRRVFATTAEFAQASKALAANQGLYNGFLAAGLGWGLLRRDEGRSVRLFFLSCVVVAAVFGAVTAKPAILAVQGGPALLALAATLLDGAARQSSTPRRA